MLTLITLLFLTPAQAAVKMECLSVKVSDQIAAYLDFAADAKTGRIDSEYRNGFPPVGLLVSKLKQGRAAGEYVSEEKTYNGYTGSIVMPSGFMKSREFIAKLTVLTLNKRETLRYDLKCIAR